MASEPPAPPPAPPPPSTTSLPPRPPTPGVGPHSTSPPRASLLTRVASSRTGKAGQSLWAWRKAIVVGSVLTYGFGKWQLKKMDARERDTVHDKTYLLWKIYDGGIVEAKSTASSLNYLLTTSGGSPEEPPRVQTLFEVIRTIKFIQADDRIRGIVADFSATSIPAVPAYSLGLAQIEEIQDALLELRKVKQEKFGKDGWRTVAWTDTFSSQGQFLLASAFDEVYTQPTGEVPLVGMGSTIPFFGRLAKWLGIEVHAEARNEYKSFVQPYIDEKFTKPQRANQEELINDLNDNLLTYIARNRFPDAGGREGLEKVRELSQIGPFTSSQAVAHGLLDGSTYRQDIVDSVLDEEKGGDPGRDVKGFYHYAKIMERATEKANSASMDVGVVYLLGTIGDAGEFGTAAVVRGLREAGEDDTIGAVVLRVDSGGGGVVESDTIWAAVRELREKYGKTVVASFANASASGGYLVSTHADAIFASPSTVTGSIGVASIRPTFLSSFFDRFHVNIESFFTGSRAQDVTHSLTPEELKRHQFHIDEMYADFKNRVCTGRGVDPEVIDLIAGGRVMTGLKAFGLTAPPELIDQIKGLDVPPLATIQEIVDVPAQADVLAHSPLEAGEEPSGVVQLDQDQETSPFAPPAVVEAAPDTFVPAHTVDPAEANASTALDTATADELVPPANPAFTPNTTGIYPITLGPFGRGLVDGLGGIRDAAVYACELFISNGIAGYKEDHPDVTSEEAARVLLPNGVFQAGPSGEMLLMMDVRLKRFPVQKSFWQQFNELSQRGDSIDQVSLGQFIKAQAAAWFFKMAASVVASEMEDLGLADSSRGLGLGKSSRQQWLRAEWPGIGGLR